MLYLLRKNGKAPVATKLTPGAVLPDNLVWIDLLNPTREEELAAEAALGILLPTREEMAEIEISSRLYRENGAVFMTAALLANSDSAQPQIGPVTFVLSKNRLVTIRYVEPRAFELFRHRLDGDPASCTGGTGVFLNLLDIVIDRLADTLERTAAEVETLSTGIFRSPSKIDFKKVMDRLGGAHGVNAKVRESSASLMRLLIYAGSNEMLDPDPAAREHLSSLQHDLHSLTDHSSYVAGNITFLLDAALGLINIEQNAIIKIFSIASVIFLPPTLVASYFGMNFTHMAEFQWPAGEYVALGLMISSVIAPLWFFRRKGWL